MQVSAPGKLMLCGEYIVLDGAPAAVASVRRRVRATLGSTLGSPPAVEPATPLPPEGEAALSLAQARFGRIDRPILLQTEALFSNGRKLGLGSSAASTVAVCAAVAAAHGHRPSDVRRTLLTTALGGHRAVAPLGSGADVAAAALGGCIRFESAFPAEAAHFSLPPDLTIHVVWTGHPVRTSDLLARVRGLRQDNPRAYRGLAHRLRAVSERLLESLSASSSRSIPGLATEHGEAMGALGSAADAPIMTAALRRIDALARTFGGGAKPSGAGGGDIALAFFDPASDPQGFAEACARQHLTLLSLGLSDEGARLDPTPAPMAAPGSEGPQLRKES